MLTFIDGEPLKARLLLRGSTVVAYSKWGGKLKGRKKKKKNIEDITFLTALKSNIQSLQHYFILCKSKYYFIGGIWG